MIDSPHRHLPSPRDLALPDGRTIAIRTAVPDDAGAVVACLKQVGAESTYLTFGGEGRGLDEVEQRAALAQLLAADNALALVAMDGERVVGNLVFEGGARSRIRHTGELGISVLQAYAGKGLGRALLEMLIEWAEGSGVIRKLDLKVRADNLAAIRLYERLGWKIEGLVTRDLCVDGVYHDALYMGRWVDP
ncbi:MAG TPA: GNAT family N-acetyltransferase [Gemmatimonadales bacterium]|nr:GNAT family N-acetyltransferase [Gemmatimonadales bacterium]